MKRVILFISITLLFLGCVSKTDYDEIEQKYNSIQIELKQAKEEIFNLENRIEQLNDSIKILSYPADQRYNNILTLIQKDSLDEALFEIESLRKIFPKSIESKKIQTQVTIIENQKKKKREEEERKKALGFKVFKDKYIITETRDNGDVIKHTFSNFHFNRDFSFNYIDDIDEYYYRTADKGNVYIIANLSIFTKSNFAYPPSVYACKIVNGELSKLGGFTYEYASYSSYGAYLGNYADDLHDFSKVNTVKYKIACEINLEDSKQPIIIVMGKNDKIENLEGLDINEVEQKCEVIKIINRAKL